MNGPTITPHLWYDREAAEAARLYVQAFGGDSAVRELTTIEDTPSGSADIVSFSLWGQDFMAISAGPYFKFNPAISFQVACAGADEVDALWAQLSPGGKVLMELGAYPFSERFGWLEDRYGLSWQVMTAAGAPAQRITPMLMFTQEVAGKAEEALHFYVGLFPDAEAQVLSRYGAGEEPEEAGTVRLARFQLAGQEFRALDSAQAHAFTFNEAVSLMVNCRDQDEIDYYWNALSAVPEAEQCGWLKDKYGVSWQVVPANLSELMGANPEQTTPVLLAMKKIVIADLIAARDS